MCKVSVVLPIYVPNSRLVTMTQHCIKKAKEETDIDAQWVIVETESDYFLEESDIYIYEKEKTTPNRSINRAMKLVDGEFVVFLANDVVVCNKWLEKMLDCFDKKNDCGIATLGNNEHNDHLRNEIIESIYFSVCMFSKEDAYLDPNYSNIYDDTDMVMRIYSRGFKSYKNLSGQVYHNPHSTYGRQNLFEGDNLKQKEYFREKWKEHSETEIYKVLA